MQIHIAPFPHWLIVTEYTIKTTKSQVFPNLCPLQCYPNQWGYTVEFNSHWFYMMPVEPHPISGKEGIIINHLITNYVQKRSVLNAIVLPYIFSGLLLEVTITLPSEFVYDHVSDHWSIYCIIQEWLKLKHKLPRLLFSAAQDGKNSFFILNMQKWKERNNEMEPSGCICRF